MDRAGTAITGLTSHMGPGQPKVFPDKMNQESAGLKVGGDLLPVDCHRDLHEGLLSRREPTSQTYQTCRVACREDLVDPANPLS